MKSVLRIYSIWLWCEYWCLKEINTVCVVGLPYRDREAFFCQSRDSWNVWMCKAVVCQSLWHGIEPLCPWEWLSSLSRDGKEQCLGASRGRGGELSSGSAPRTIPFLAGCWLCCGNLPAARTALTSQRQLSAREGTWGICCSAPGCPHICLGQRQKGSWCFSWDTGEQTSSSVSSLLNCFCKLRAVLVILQLLTAYCG